MNGKVSGLKRDNNKIDKYYTIEENVILCIENVKKEIDVDKERDLIIEPSAGNGAFINPIKELCNNYCFYDIEPEHCEIKKEDFLTLCIEKRYRKIHIIGNPPFGRQSSMVIKFIKKSCSFCDTISFILPKSFKKSSMREKFNEYFHLQKQIDLSNNSFLKNNTTIKIPCVFQIWEKRPTPRIKEPLQTTLIFKFVKKNENPDVSFRRVGVNAGKVSKETTNKNPQSHYFIKFNNDGNVDEYIEKIKSIEFEKDNTVGPRSISKKELINEFNKFKLSN